MSGWDPVEVDDLPVVDLDHLDPPWGDEDEGWDHDEWDKASTPIDVVGHQASLRLVLVSPHPIITEALAWMLEGIDESLDIVREAHTIGEARVTVADTQPDVVLLDAAFVDDDPIALIRSLIAEHPSVAVVVLTDSENSNDLRDALAAGAKGYLLKHATSEELVNALRQSIHNEIRISDQLIERLADLMNPNGNAENLTRRELKVVDLLEKEMADAQIASILGISIRTVQKHLTNMYHKCDVANREEMIAFVRRRGVGLR